VIADAPASWDSVDAARAGLSAFDSVRGNHAALYFPALELTDPLTGRLRAFPPSGAIAGIYARTDSERGIWKAPAGTETRITGVRALTVAATDRENGLLNPLALNNIRNFPVVGPVIWGARTLEGADALSSQWKYVPVRRLALLLEESLYRGLKWVVFEPNDERLWSQIRLNVGAFLHTLFRQGAFQGTTAREAYFVKCDSSTTTQDDINRGVVNVVVGFAPLKPAEFVIVKIEQLAGQFEV
jgi:phage tail sheath protein FI